MKIKNIPYRDGTYQFIEIEDCEFVNPLRYLMESTLMSQFYMNRTHIEFISNQTPRLDFLSKELKNKNEILDRIALKMAEDTWLKFYSETMATDIPENLIALLQPRSKKEQIKLLKSTKLTTKEFTKFTIVAGEEYGYIYSTYSKSFSQKGLDKSQIPFVATLEFDHSVSSIGPTSLTEGQLKQAIQHQNRMCVKLFDKGDNWLCFFLTYKSMSGKEKAWKEGTPHMHFISSAWGHDRKKVIDGLLSGHYKFGGLPHIDYNRNQ